MLESVQIAAAMVVTVGVGIMFWIVGTSVGLNIVPATRVTCCRCGRVKFKKQWWMLSGGDGGA